MASHYRPLHEKCVKCGGELDEQSIALCDDCLHGRVPSDDGVGLFQIIIAVVGTIAIFWYLMSFLTATVPQ